MACSFRIGTLLICAGLAACNLSPFRVGAQSKRTTSDSDIDKIGHRKITIDPNFYSPEQEIKLGKQLAQAVERSSRMVGDPVVAYLNELGQKIAQNSDSHFPISFGVIDTNEIDALTLLGGHQYINRGLILQAETEGELAAVLAYGIASTVLSGATRNATKAEMMQLATIPLTLSSPGGWGGTGIYEAANLSIPITYLKLERDLAFDADYFGIQYLYKSGYDPESMPRFLERVWPLSPAGIKPVPLAFSPYPPLQDRLKAMRTEIQKILPPRDNATVSTSEFETVKEHLRAWNPPSPNDPGSGKPTLRKRASAASQSSQ